MEGQCLVIGPHGRSLWKDCVKIGFGADFCESEPSRTLPITRRERGRKYKSGYEVLTCVQNPLTASNRLISQNA